VVTFGLSLSYKRRARERSIYSCLHIARFISTMEIKKEPAISETVTNQFLVFLCQVAFATRGNFFLVLRQNLMKSEFV
jgi:hypothetical protein